MPGIIGTIIILFFVLIVFTKQQQASALDGLPNYTEVKEKIEVKGLNYEKQPHLGNPSAKVKVVEFADFKCPVCKNWAQKNIPILKKDFIDTGKVELYFINYAFLDRDSYMAAMAGESIAKQSNDKFWEYYDKLYANQGKETEIWATQKFILDCVKKNIQGIDYAQFEKDIKNHTYLYDVKEDFKIGGFYGVNGTPQFMVNGKLVRAATYEELKAAIEREL
jgi:protein-disulfide isomerase